MALALFKVEVKISIKPARLLLYNRHACQGEQPNVLLDPLAPTFNDRFWFKEYSFLTCCCKAWYCEHVGQSEKKRENIYIAASYV